MKPLRRPPAARGDELRTTPDQGPARCFYEQAAQYVWRHKMKSYLAFTTTLAVISQYGLSDHLNRWVYGG